MAHAACGETTKLPILIVVKHEVIIPTGADVIIIKLSLRSPVEKQGSQKFATAHIQQQITSIHLQMNSIPTIDISPLIHLNERSCNNTSTINDDDDRLKNTIKQIKHACTTVGFFAIINHGVSNGSIANAWDTSTQFFDCDTSIKESVPMTPTYPYGYENFESLGIERSVSSTASSADNLLVDSKETFSIGPSNSELSGMPPRQFPSKPIALESALSQYFNDMEKLAQVLFRGLALALELNEDWFLLDGRFTSEGRQSALRVLNYPALEYNKEEEEKEKIHIRAGAHTDYGEL